MRINSLADRHFRHGDLSTVEFVELYDACFIYLRNQAVVQPSFFLLADNIDEIIFQSIEDALVVKENRKHFNPEIGGKFNSYIRKVFIHDFIDEYHRINKRIAYKRRITITDENNRDIFDLVTVRTNRLTADTSC